MVLKNKQYHTGEIIWLNSTYMQNFLSSHKSSPKTLYIFPHQESTRPKTLKKISILFIKPNKQNEQAL